MEDQKPLEVSAEDALEAKREKKRLSDREAQRRKRQRDREAKAATDSVSDERVQVSKILEHLRQLRERDDAAAGQRYKSEARSYFELGVYYYGLQRSEVNRLDEAFDNGDTVVSLAFSNIKPYTTAILDAKLSFDEWLGMRDKARKDLFFLGRHVLGIKFLREEVHKIVFDQFMQKDFDGAFPDGYDSEDIVQAFNRQKRYATKTDNGVVTESDVLTRQMMLLDPRAFGKSTANRVDCISWMINVPDVRILILTGRRKLGQTFLENIKKYLTLGELGRPSPFHLLFPEYVHTTNLGTAQFFISPARILPITDATLEADGIESNLSGAHYDVLKGDDVITDENSNTEATRESLRMKYDGVILNLPDEHGVVDIIGTRYWVDDFYGTRLNPGVDEDGLSLDTPIKYFRRQAWYRLPEYPESQVTLRQIQEHMVTLPFPTKATFKVLRYKLLQNERSFRNQQLNEPTNPKDESNFIITFTRDGLRANSYPMAGVPAHGYVVMAGDTAISTRATADNTCFVVGKIWEAPKTRPDQPTLYGLTVLEVAFGKWNQSDIALNLVRLNCKYSLSRPILIEKAAGAETLQDKIRQEALRRCGKQAQISFITPSNVKNAKATRIKGLQILLDEGRLKFVNQPEPIMEAMYEQFEKFTTEPGNKGRNDDIPDAISLLARFLPASSQPNADLDALKKEQETREIAAQAAAQYASIFGNAHEQPRSFVSPPAFASRPVNTKSDIYREKMRKLFGRS